MAFGNEVSGENTQADLLVDEVNSFYQFEYATQGQRFLNWLIDNLLIRYGLAYATGTGIGYLLALIAPDFISGIVNDYSGNINWSLWTLGFVIAYINYIIYYTVCEKLFRGYTLGKLITGTRAIRQDGNELTFRNALMRSLSRCVPFEVFSGFSTLAWHDQWTDTMVIKAR